MMSTRKFSTSSNSDLNCWLASLIIRNFCKQRNDFRPLLHQVVFLTQPQTWHRALLFVARSDVATLQSNVRAPLFTPSSNRGAFVRTKTADVTNLHRLPLRSWLYRRFLSSLDHHLSYLTVYDSNQLGEMMSFWVNSPFSYKLISVEKIKIFEFVILDSVLWFSSTL